MTRNRRGAVSCRAAPRFLTRGVRRAAGLGRAPESFQNSLSPRLMTKRDSLASFASREMKSERSHARLSHYLGLDEQRKQRKEERR